MNENPFEAPSAALDAPEATSEYTPLYSSANVVGTTLLGSALAGAVLVVLNGLKVGRVVEAVLFAGAFNVAMLIAVFVLPEEIPSFVYTIVSLLGMRGVNEALFGTDLAVRQAEGVPTAPWWHGLIIGFVTLSALLALIIGLLVLAGEI